MPRLLLFLVFSIVFSITQASPFARDKTPEPLKPWVDWVLQDEEDFDCPFFYNNFQNKQCSWPGKLNLVLTTTKAQFTSQWQTFNENWIALPGNKNNWPQNVTINNEAALVINKQGTPVINVAPGSYKIEGDFFWNKIPESLALPQNTGLFSLSVNGNKIFQPILKNGMLWLKQSDRGEQKTKSEENKLDLQVFRKVYDDVPLQLITYLELEVSGDQREINLPHALLANLIPISLQSHLPAKIEPNGSLLVQVRPGRWHIEIAARYPEPVTQLTFILDDPTWPKTEIWSFQAVPYQRIVEIKDLKVIDPSLSNVPKQWKNLPAYQVNQGDQMTFKVIRRGDPEPEPNQLSLKRQLWLDFDGKAYSASDTISGKMTSGWRLDALSETQLGQVKLNGQNQLITTSTDTSKQGVEVRKGTISLQADSRITGDISQLNAVGWDQDFHQLKTELNIPPGWRLLAASGVDNVPNSWLSRWTLLDLFLVLIAALAIGRLWSVYWGIFAMISLSLCWHEPQSPHFIWLNILAAIALIRVLPVGKFQVILKWYRNFCWLFLLAIAIPFMVAQVRIGLYPQLEKQWQNISPGRINANVDYINASYKNKPKLDSMEEQTLSRGLSSPKIARAINPSSPSPYKSSNVKLKLDRIDPNANIQTGSGLPEWQWKKIYLSWNGAVDSQQQIEFWYISPTISMLLNFLRVLLVCVLTLLMFGVLDKKFTFPKGLMSCLLLISLSGIPLQKAHADFPEQKLLDELKSRLIKSPDCIPECAQIPVMDLTINAKQLSIKLQVHSQQAVAIPLPAQQDQWVPNIIKLNNKPAKAVIRTEKGQLWMSLQKGFNSIELQGINPIQNKFSLALPLKPHRTNLTTDGWIIEGVFEGGKTENQLIFNRVKSAKQLKSTKNKLEPGVLPAFIRIERTLHLGLDWRISSRVVRASNNDAAIAIKLPLLKGEFVTTEKIRVKDNHLFINLSSRDNSLQWDSTLKKSPKIDLLATQTNRWTEVWRADVSPIWHLQTSGISVVHHQDKGRWLPEWRPWPGEKVSLIISKPEAVQGATLTIDRSELKIKPGKRSLENELKINLRSSKGTQHTITLPEQAELQFVKINGTSQPIRQKGSKVTLPVRPGKQNVLLNWRTKQQQANFLASPVVNLGIASVNNHINISLGQDRWVLFTSGPKFGPAVLFWGVMIVIIILAIALGKISMTPLKHWHWFLLLIGLSQIAIEAAMVVIIWLMALGVRAKKQITDANYFNISQIALGLLTLASISLLFIAVQQGLLGSPDMQIVGNQSSAYHLNWYQDRLEQQLPIVTIVSVPMLSYRILMLLWALWLAVSLLNWLKWGWECFSSDGLWKKNQPLVQGSSDKETKVVGD